MSSNAPFSLYQGLFRDFAYAYQYWFTPMLQAFSPTMYFGCNIQDAGVEKHVLDNVGSYGFQINRLMDAVMVLASRADLSTLTPAETGYIGRFKELAKAADRAASDFQTKPRHGVTMAELDRMIDAVLSLQADNPDAYRELVRHGRERLGAAVE
jgi:hypothetical protein